MAIKKGDNRNDRDGSASSHMPAGSYWGARTIKAREAAVPLPMHYRERFIDAFLLVKKAAAVANAETGRLEAAICRAICQCCDEILSGQWRDQFLTDVYLLGGWALNGNINEVIANRAAETQGGTVGNYSVVHPDKHVNLGQANADVYPTAVRLALLLSLRELEPSLLDLERLLRRKSLEFERVVKVGRTNLRDSLPVTLGQEFNAYGATIERSLRRIKEASSALHELNIGATHVGTGLGAEPQYVTAVVAQLSLLSGLTLRPADDFFRISQSMADFVEFSGALKVLALELVKIVNDLRLLNSGPAGGFGEIKIPFYIGENHPLMPEHLPEKTAGDLLESVAMVSYQVLANDAAVCLCAQSGLLEGNSTLPLIGETMLQSLELLKHSLNVFNQKCLAGVTADTARLRKVLLNSESVSLVLAWQIGEEKAAQVLNEAQQSGKTIEDIVLERKLMSKEAFEKSIYLRPLTRPGKIPQATAPVAPQVVARAEHP